jgi:hypothetical protein
VASLFNALQHLNPQDLEQQNTTDLRASGPLSAPGTPKLEKAPGTPKLEKHAPATPKLEKHAPGTPKLGSSNSLLPPPKPKFTKDTLDLWKRTLTAILALSPIQVVEGATSDHAYPRVCDVCGACWWC